MLGITHLNTYNSLLNKKNELKEISCMDCGTSRENPGPKLFELPESVVSH